MEFTFSKRARTLSIALMVVGTLLALAGVLGDHSDHHQRSWTSFFANSFFYFGIALGTLYFFALQYATESAWSALLKRVYEAIMSFLPIGAVLLVICFAAGFMGLHHIWHWMDPALSHEYMIGSGHEARYLNEPLEGAVVNPLYDEVIAGKSVYLNQGFFWARVVVYLGTFLLFARWFRRQSLKMDQQTGDTLVRSHLTNYKRGALFLVFFAVFSSMLSWDWLMSIDVHWFSTLFGWYTFSGMWVSAMITAVVLVLYLKGKGYLPQVNNSHIHDMGKWVFAISFLWSYLWFSQFMLYWYANIPEEVTYFRDRVDPGLGLENGFRWPFFITFLINFAVPMVLLMSRDAKRNPRFLIGVGTVIFIGHWLDIQVMVQPGALGHWHLGLPEIGMFLAFLGLLIFVTLTRLTRAPLSPAHHPYLEESVHHHI